VHERVNERVNERVTEPSLRLDSDDFTLFGLPQQFAVDRAQLDAQWRRLQAATHPDKFAAQGTSAQRVAMQWAVRVNQAYQRLKEPMNRAAYLCELRGASVDAERNTAMPAHFLMQQMAWRESLEDARTLADVQALQTELNAQQEASLTDAARLLDEDGQPAAAAQQVRALMFMRRFQQDIDRRLDALDPNR
jgi:molecular chaperone HscB